MCGTQGDLHGMLREEQPLLRGNAERTEVSRGHSSCFIFQRRTESIGVLSTTGKGGMSRWVQKTKEAAYKEIARNVKGM